MAKEPTNYPSDAADKYVLRFPDGMRERLKSAAAENNRTLNAEIIAALQERQRLRDELLSTRALLASETQRANENAKKLSDIDEKERASVVDDIRRSNQYLELAQATQLRYRDLVMFFNLYIGVLRNIEHKFPSPLLQDHLYQTLSQLVNHIIQMDESISPAQAISDFLGGSADPSVASKIRAAFDNIEWASKLMDAREEKKASSTQGKRQPRNK